MYEEADGIYIAKQNRKKNKQKRKGKQLKIEIKIAVIHEGFEKRYSKDVKLVNKQVIATTKKASHLRKLVDMTIGTKYQVDKIKKIIINADGSDWCQSIAEGANEEY